MSEKDVFEQNVSEEELKEVAGGMEELNRQCSSNFHHKCTSTPLYTETDEKGTKNIHPEEKLLCGSAAAKMIEPEK